MVELEQNLSRIQKEGLGLAAISYDSVAILKNFADRRKITFPLLSDDPGSECCAPLKANPHPHETSARTTIHDFSIRESRTRRVKTS